MIPLDINAARARFRLGPLGRWFGWSDNAIIGVNLTFKPNGTGEFEAWGLYYFDPNPADEPLFHWRSVGDRRIEIIHQRETRLINYDFRIVEDQYNVKSITMFELGKEPGAYGEIGFWESPYSLLYSERQPHHLAN